MNRIFLILAAAAIWCSIGCSQPSAMTVTVGNLQTYDNFESKYVAPRTIRVWTPAGYSSDKQYDVLYMHDGQMLYDAEYSWNHQEWGIDEALDSLIRQGVVRPCIVVGIDNTEDRFAEYFPDDALQYYPSGEKPDLDFTPKGNAYLKFVFEELKPFIDAHYSTHPEREHTHMMGSSCGGLITSYALCKYPEMFSSVACLSTHSSMQYSFVDSPDPKLGEAYRSYLQHCLPEKNSCLLYMDIGNKTIDADYQESQAIINRIISGLGWDETHFIYRFYDGDEHSEDCWRARLPIVLKVLIGVK